MRRPNNQDAYVASLAGSAAHWQERGHLFCVADGMGAHAAGELASKLAVDQIPLNYDKRTELPPAQAIFEAIREANAAIHARGQSNVEFHNMGTTCSSLLLLPYGAVVAHVGDSRVYRLRGTTLQQLTFDHSLVWEMAEAGSISERDIPQYVPKNVITRSLGPHENVSIDLEGTFPVDVGDTFLLCSDGLTGPVTDKEIGTILACLPPNEASQTLVDLACLRGGPDNVTCVVVRATEELSARTASAAVPAQRTEEDKLPPPPPPVHPAVWAIIAASFVAGLIFATMRLWLPALVAAGILALCLVAIAIRRLPQPGRDAGGQRAFGRGPYRSYDCRPDAQSVAALTTLLADMRIEALENGWNIDWDPIDEQARAAHEAAQQGDYQSAIAKHAAAVRLLMQQIREERTRPLSDSRIGL
jgi:protein phosphatase